MRRVLPMVLAVSLLACEGQDAAKQPPATPTTAEAAPTPAPEPAPEPAAKAEPEPAAQAEPSDELGKLASRPPNSAGPLQFIPDEGPGGALPYEDPDPESMSPSAVWDFGWTKDSSGFAYCNYDGSDEGGSCYLVGTDAKIRETTTVDRWDAFAAKHGPFDRGRKDWAYSEVAIVWKRSGPKLSLGGRVVHKGKSIGVGKPDMLRWSFDDETYFDGEGDVGPGVVSISPDKQHMAIVAVALLGFIDEQRFVAVESTDEFAARVYAAHGFEQMKAKSYAEAERWFLVAGGASPEWKHPYNLACARALGGLDGVEVALREAIERGGSKVADKAREDADLASVRDQPWFAAAVGADG